MRAVRTLVSALVLAVLLMAASPLPARAVSETINYQGKLMTSANVAVPDGQYNMRFWLLTSPSIATSSAVWTESLTGSNRVQVTNGLFSVMLGSTTPLSSVDFSQTLYLGVEVGGTSTPGWDGEMSPRKLLGTVPAAFEAENAQTLDGIATSSFLRSDQADSASGLLTFTGGIISSASSTITNLTTSIATTTTLVINNQAFTNLLGTGLTNQSGVLTVSTTTLGFGTLAALNSIDISSHTNLAISATGLTLSGDSIAFAAGYNIPLTASTTEWSGFYTTPSTRISDGTGLTWSGNTLNVDDAYLLNTGDSGTGNYSFSNGTFSVSGTTTLATGTSTVGIGTTTPGARLTIQGLNGIDHGSAPTDAPLALEVIGGTGGNCTLGGCGAGDGGGIVLRGGEGGFSGLVGGAGGDVTLQGGLPGEDGGPRYGYVLLNPSFGNVGIGNSAPTQAFHVTGNARITGALYDSSNSAGTTGMVLRSTGTGMAWTATSSLGLGLSGGVNGYLARWTGANTLSTGLFRDNGTVAGINATTSTSTFLVQGSGSNNAFTVASSTGALLMTVTPGGGVFVGSTAATGNGSGTMVLSTPNQSNINILDLQVNAGSKYTFNSTNGVTWTAGGASNGSIANTFSVGVKGAINVTGEGTPITVTNSSFTITGSYATQRFARFTQPTITAGSSLGITGEASTINISGAPISAGSATIANSIALRISSDTSVASGVTNAYGLYVSAPTGAANNYPAVFTGGNVGIGTSTPSSILSIAGNDPVISIRDTNASGATFQFRNGVAGTGVFDLYDSNDDASAFSWSNEQFRIGTTSNVTGNPSRLFVFGGPNGANVDVMGDPSIVGGDQATIDLQSSTFESTSKSAFLQYINHGIGTSLGFSNDELARLVLNGDTNLIYTGLTQPLIFGTDSTERMRISATGDLGIGTTTPLAALHVVKTDNASNTSMYGQQIDLTAGGGSNLFSGSVKIGLDITNSASGTYAGGGTNHSVYGVNSHATFDGSIDGDGGGDYLELVGVRGSTGGTPTVYDNSDSIISAGLYGMATGDLGTTTGGTNHAGAYLSASGVADRNAGLYVANISGATENNGIFLNQSSGASNWAIYSLGTAKSYFAGSIGIGTTSPSHLLTVAGDANFTGALRMSGNAGTAGQILQSTGSGAQWVATSSLGISGSLWSQNGSEIYYNTNNVGIGISDPQYTLHVHSTGQSDMAITTDSNVGSFNVAQLSFVSDLNGTPTYSSIGQANTGDLKLSSIGNLVSPDMTLAAATGYVGIGTTSPASTLDVWGGFRVGTSSTPTLFVNAATRRVGIGTASPTALLSLRNSPSGTTDANIFDLVSNHAIGSVTTSGARILSAGSSTLLVSGDFAPTTGTNVVNMTLDRKVIDASGIVMSDLAGGSSRNLVTLSAQSILATGTPTFDDAIGNGLGNFLNIRGLDVTTTISPIDMDAGGVSILNVTAGRFNNASVITTSNVGIISTGIDVANNAAHVSSNGTKYGGSFAVSGAASLSTGLYVGQVDGATTNMGLRLSTGIAAGANNYSIYSDSDAQSYFAGNIGIGTSTPSAKLDVWGGFRVGTSSTPTFMVNSGSGLVGINTADPTAFLEIMGTGSLPYFSIKKAAEAGDEYVLIGDGSIRIGQSGSTNIILDQGVGVSNTTFQTQAIDMGDIDGAGNSTFLSIYDSSQRFLFRNGSVGIGTTTPSQLFTVSGTSSLRTILPETNLSYNLGSSAQRWNEGWISTLNIGTSTWSMTQSANGRFSLFDAASGGGNERFTVLSNGNVGIGATDPAAVLSVGAGSHEASIFSVVGSGAGNIVNIRDENGENVFQVAGTVGGDLQLRLGDFAGAGTNHYFAIEETQARSYFMNGNVGIGTTTPSFNLDVIGNIAFGGSTARALLADDYLGGEIGLLASVGGVDSIIAARGGDGGYYYGGGDLNSPKLMVSAAGNVGIGTSTPTAGLHLVDPSASLIIQSPGNGALSLNYGGLTMVNTAGEGLSIYDDGWTNLEVYGSGRAININSTDDIVRLTAGGAGITVSNGGNVGIGAASSDSLLAIINSGSGTNFLTIGADESNERYAQFSDSEIRFGDIDGVINGNMLTIDITGPNGNMTYNNGNFIMGTGWIGIGTSSPQRALHVRIGTDAPPVRFQDSNGYCEINPTSTTWTCTSDERLKENIESLDAADILANLSELRPVSFAWKTDATHADRIGLIAQEVEEFFPDLVATDPQSGMKSVAYGGFTPYLIAGVQELARANSDLAALLMTGTSTFATSSPFAALLEAEDSLWSRLVALAENFMDGVLTIAGVRTDELCVGSVCIDEATFLQMVEQSGGTPSVPSNTEDDEDEPPYIEDTGNGTSTPEGDEGGDGSAGGGTDGTGGEDIPPETGGEADPPTDPVTPEPDPEEVTDEEPSPEPEEDPEPAEEEPADTGGETGGEGV